MKLAVVDFETEGIQARPEYPPKPVGVAVREPGARKGKYHCWGHPGENNCSPEEAKRRLSALWSDPSVCIAFHNAKFDEEVALVHMGLPLLAPSRVHDSMVLGFLDDPYARTLELKPMAEKHLGEPPVERDELRDWIVENVAGAKHAKKEWGRHICKAPANVVGPYAVGDVDRTHGLVKKLLPMITERGMNESYMRELKLSPILIENERSGVCVDLPKLENDVALYNAALTRVDEWVRKKLKAKELNLDEREELSHAIDKAGLATGGWLLTPTGKMSTSKESLEHALKDKLLVAVLSYRGSLATCLRTFMEPWLSVAREAKGRIHTRWHSTRGAEQFGARTGRLCVAKGALVMQPGRSVPIQDVRVGDLVYCFDDALRPTLKPVTWAGKTGVKKVLRLHWIGTGRHTTGTLDVTPNHPIRLWSGEYKKAKDLMVGDSVLAMHRGKKDYNYLCISRYGKEVKEAVFICDTLHGPGRKGRAGDHVHHKDEDKFNDDPQNLERLSATEHTAQHGRELWARGKMGNAVRIGSAHPNYKGVTKRRLLSALKQNNHRILKTAVHLNMGYGTLKARLREHGLDWRGQSLKSNARKVALDRARIIEGRRIHAEQGQNAAQRYIGVNYYKWRNLQKLFGFEPLTFQRGYALTDDRRFNHKITRIEVLDDPVPVYDLEVEGAHNFIANELCTHNSSTPNFQNIPTLFEDEQKLFASVRFFERLKSLDLPPLPTVRSYIVADSKGSVLCGRDYTSQELRVLAHYEDGVLARQYREDPRMDVHQFVADMLNKQFSLSVTRQGGKTLNFLKVYGGGVAKLAVKLGVDMDTAKRIMNAYLSVFPGLKDLNKDMKQRGQAGQPIRTLGGRLYYAEPPRVINNVMRTFEYKLLNYLVQGSSADMTKEAVIRYNEVRGDSRLIMTVHDEVLTCAAKGAWKKEMRKLKEAMESVEIDVPLLSEGSVGYRWTEMEDCD